MTYYSIILILLAFFIIAFIGAPQSKNANNAGKVHIVWGKRDGFSEALDLSQADVTYQGEEGFDELGSALSAGADVNRDGISDLLLGAYMNEDTSTAHPSDDKFSENGGSSDESD